MIERLDLIEKRYHEIQELLMQPDVLNDIKKSKDLSIELSSIEDTVNCYNKYKNVLTDLKEAHEMLKEEDLKDFALEEIERLNQEKSSIEQELETLLIPKDKNDLKMLLWKFGELLVVMKEISLLEIYFVCTKSML